MVEGEKVMAGTEAELEEGEIVGSPHGVVPPAELKEKHPLEHSWTFWFDNPSGKNKQQQWGSSLRPVYTVGTVEDFWCLYNNLVPPGRLVSGADFHCFKEGIKPEWEDPKCSNGGKWTAAPRGSKVILDQFWLNTLLALIGEQFDEGDEICGVVVSVRPRGDKLSLWTKTASNESVQMSIGKQWKEFIEYPEKINYMFHEDAKRDQKARNRYSV